MGLCLKLNPQLVYFRFNFRELHLHQAVAQVLGTPHATQHAPSYAESVDRGPEVQSMR